MSFYGDIKRAPSSPYIFDKYYPNRLTMDQNAATDGVYVGRYVLVKYTVRDPADTSGNLPYFDKFVPDGSSGKKVYQGYKYNADKDLNSAYQDTFDGTVWQKVYTNLTGNSSQEVKYILIAELNASVPRLELKIVNPKYLKSNVEHWRQPSIAAEASSEDAYRINLPNIIHLDVGDIESDFYAKDLINPQKRLTKTITTQNGGVVTLSHDQMLSQDYNYMAWENYLNGEKQTKADGDIDEKKLDVKLYAFGQVISDLYDALYGVPATGTGNRPFYTSTPENVLANYDKGLIGVLSSIATDIKGDLAKDLYGRTLHPGMHYYFASSWNSVEENPDNFIENIPKVIGSNEDKQNKMAHYGVIDLWNQID